MIDSSEIPFADLLLVLKTVEREGENSIIHHGTPHASFKACVFLIELLLKGEPGATDPRELIRQQCRGDEETYQNRCRELGIEP